MIKAAAMDAIVEQNIKGPKPEGECSSTPSHTSANAPATATNAGQDGLPAPAAQAHCVQTWIQQVLPRVVGKLWCSIALWLLSAVGSCAREQFFSSQSRSLRAARMKQTLALCSAVKLNCVGFDHTVLTYWASAVNCPS
eukprot:TRINITY_DN4879_c0_g5_i1.p1 TRINITY_DN4879_c0_g5~~TRINITY_DN4879_c0_g5_i1.p1  ORF type:complete len:139 (-),score=12.50 TRINITY_DN4879_c0_g5_i1:81-497(-)